MQLAFDAVDRLVELLEERRRPVSPVEAAAHVFALRSAPEGLARSLIGDLVAGDSRLQWRGSAIGLASVPDDPPLEEAELVVFDLETTGLSARSSRICEIGAVRVHGLEIVDSFQTLVRTGAPLPGPITAITGIRDEDLRDAPGIDASIRRFLASRPRARAVCTGSGRSPMARLRGPGCTCSGTGTGSSSMSAEPATFAPGCARTSARTASGLRSRPRSGPSSGSSGTYSAAS